MIFWPCSTENHRGMSLLIDRSIYNYVLRKPCVIIMNITVWNKCFLLVILLWNYVMMELIHQNSKLIQINVLELRVFKGKIMDWNGLTNQFVQVRTSFFCRWKIVFWWELLGWAEGMFTGCILRYRLNGSCKPAITEQQVILNVHGLKLVSQLCLGKAQDWHKDIIASKAYRLHRQTHKHGGLRADISAANLAIANRLSFVAPSAESDRWMAIALAINNWKDANLEKDRSSLSMLLRAVSQFLT